MLTKDRAATTIRTAWGRLLEDLEHESVCYRAGDEPGGDFRPVSRDGVNYGQAVANAVELLQSRGRLTIDQIDAVRCLCRWVAKAAREKGK